MIGPSSRPSSPTSPPRVQVLVIYHDGPELLLSACRSLEAGMERGLYRMAVVDSGSSDGGSAAARRECPGLEVLATENRGYAAAVNAGMRAFAADYHLVLNSDTEVSPAAVAALVGFMEERPRCAVASPREVDGRGWPQLAWGRFPTVLGELRRSGLQRRIDRGAPLPRGLRDPRPPLPVRVDWVSGSSMLVRAAASRETGGMDEGYFLYFEDVDWCRAMAGAGWEAWYCPQVEILHHRSRTAGKDPARSRLWFYQSRLRYFRKWKGRASFHFLRLCLLSKLWLEARQGGAPAGGEEGRPLGPLIRLVGEARYRP